MTTPTLSELGIVTVTINGFTLYHRIPGGPAPADADGVEWVTEKLTGWGGAGVRAARAARPLGRHGSFRGQSSRTERIIGLTFAVSTPYDRPEMGPALDRRVAAMCADTSRLHTLTVDDPWSGPLSADVELDDEILPEWVSRWTMRHSAQFAAPDPRLHGPWITYETPLPEPPVGGLNFTAPGLNFTAPGLDFGTPGSPGTVMVPNPGTADAAPVLELVGPLPDAQVICMETGVRASFTQPVEAGHSMWINCDEFPALGLPGLSVLLDAQSDRRRWWTVPRGWPLIPAGGSVTFALRSSAYNPDAKLRVRVRSAWW